MNEQETIAAGKGTLDPLVLPLCLHCGGKPELKRKTVDSCEGWASDYYEWIECECGMRTIERSTTYYRPKVIKTLIDIFSRPNSVICDSEKETT